MSRFIVLMALVLLAPAQASGAEEIRIAWLGWVPPERAPSVLDGPRPADLGLAGLRLAVADGNAGGRFLGQSFRLIEVEPGPKAAEFLVRENIRYVVADLPAADLPPLADALRAGGVIVFNTGAEDDSLREKDCRANLLHTLPSRAMQADALAQVLVRRNWKKWAMLVGPAPEDQLRAAAIRRAARKFGARIVAEKPWTYTRDAQRSAEGEVALLTRDWSYDVLLVADEGNEFGDLAVYNTFEPRMVAGTQGLTASAWHPAHDQWGATQAQNRFRALAGRAMGELDFAAWVAGRAVAEAAMRARSADPERITATMRGQDFTLPVYKGRSAGFRAWDGQLRQPLLVGWARNVVATAPQEGFLHPVTDLDTLGTDKGENACVPR
jgi:ABC transporter substrate binding protein (PQQ-dependent alcohol dehydrogenase system)